jgi:MoxR-like ATPase
LSDYVLDLAQATRQHPRVSLGLSTRGALALLRAARVHAGLASRDFVAPDDVQAVARWVLAHRLVLKPEAALEGETDLGIVGSILDATPVPR